MEIGMSEAQNSGMQAEQPQATRQLVEDLPEELLAIIFFSLKHSRDRCNFHNSCKAIKNNGTINKELRKLVLGCETQEAAISQIVTFPRALEHLVLCSRLPITSGYREMYTLGDPEPLVNTLIKLADTASECEAARERLAALKYLTLQGWIAGNTQRSLPWSGNELLNLCSGLQELNFLACVIPPDMEVVLQTPSPSAPQLQSLSLHACTLPRNNSLNFATALTSLTSLSIRMPRATRRCRPSSNGGGWAFSRVDLSAVSKLVSLRSLVCVCNEDDGRSRLPQLSGPLRCCGLGQLARCCTNLTHLEFGLGDVGEPYHWALNSEMDEEKLPSLRTLALPCASPAAILALLRPRGVGRTLQLLGETSIRLPARQAPSQSLQEEQPAHAQAPNQAHAPAHATVANQEHGNEQAMEQHQQHEDDQEMPQVQQHAFFHQLVQHHLVHHHHHHHQVHQQQPQLPNHQDFRSHMRAHVRQHRSEQVPCIGENGMKILQADDPEGLLEEAAAAIADNAHQEHQEGAATHLSLKPLVRNPESYGVRSGFRMCDAGIHIKKLSPLANHVKHLCLGQMCLGVEGDADALVSALPRLQTLRLENCKLKASTPRQYSAEGHEVAGKDSGLAVIMKGLLDLTRVDLIGGSVGEEEDLFNAAAQASGMQSETRIRLMNIKLPQLHLICEDLEGVDASRSMAAWSQRQAAYLLFEDEPMRVKLRVKS